MAMTWQFTDEGDAESEHTLALVMSEGAVVPPIWTYEVVNALVVAERKQRIRAHTAAPIYAALTELPISIDDRPVDGFGLIELARRLGLTTYDAAYLELASRTGVGLATRDRRLAAGASRVGVSVVGMPAP
ncbi:MAG: type II toxin-antitoxin system VapC family toxin [Alphaproteobacteria bacterium]|nr:type II toxin-antitoxin system VapC family toxin [Alphaproteobacteria bacterium]